MKLKENKYWLKDLSVKESVSNKKVVSNMIIEIGSNILNDMLLEKYNKIVG